MLAYLYRFHGHSSLKYVYKNGTVLRTQLFTLKYVKNSKRSNPRVAIVVSKKVHKSAVKRNRVRRRMYELFRQHVSGVEEAYDIVCIITSPNLIDVGVNDLSKQVTMALVKAGLYKNT